MWQSAINTNTLDFNNITLEKAFRKVIGLGQWVKLVRFPNNRYIPINGNNFSSISSFVVMGLTGQQFPRTMHKYSSKKSILSYHTSKTCSRKTTTCRLASSVLFIAKLVATPVTIRCLTISFCDNLFTPTPSLLGLMSATHYSGLLCFPP